jgi:tetratricopeptide (TPR) repeat protein
MTFDELDNVDLGGGVEQVPPGGAARYRGPESTFEDERAESPEIAGAIKFNEAEIAMADGDHASAVGLLEQAYENGFDVAELHAMLAYARFMAAGQDKQTADHAFELLDYAQSMDPSLDMVHAYRGAIYSALRQPQRAREALDRALELNPYCELAMQIMDSLG